MNQTASLVEILTVAINALGILTAARMLMLTKARYDAVLKSGGYRGGPRALAAWRHFRCEGARIAYHAVSLGLGLWAMLLPNPATLYGETAMWARVFLGTLFTAMSVLDLMSDGRLDALLREPQARQP
jgi:hypothetical protein